MNEERRKNIYTVRDIFHWSIIVILDCVKFGNSKFKTEHSRDFLCVVLFYIYITGYSYLNMSLIVTHPVRYSAFVTSLHIGKVNLGLSGPAGWSENMVNVLLKLQKKFD